MNEPSEQPPAPLEYAPAPPRRWKWIRRAVLIVLILGVSITGWRYGSAAWSQGKLLYWQRQCMNYSAPADQIVYEEEPATTAKLLADTRYIAYPLRRNTPGASQPSAVGAAFQPACWDAFNRTAALPRVLTHTTTPASGAIIFLHELTSPGGNRRLVCVQYTPDPVGFTSLLVAGHNYKPDVITPAGFDTRPQWRSWAYNLSVGISQPRVPPQVRVYAGQTDPNDPSHFTIRCQMWGQEDVIDGWLDDQDRITLKQRQIPREPRQ